VTASGIRCLTSQYAELSSAQAEDLYLSGSGGTVAVRTGTKFLSRMVRDQQFSSLFRHYAKNHDVDASSLVFFTEKLMRELNPLDTPRSAGVQ
jgi:speckle-type POZ protein